MWVGGLSNPYLGQMHKSYFFFFHLFPRQLPIDGVLHSCKERHFSPCQIFISLLSRNCPFASFLDPVFYHACLVKRLTTCLSCLRIVSVHIPSFFSLCLPCVFPLVCFEKGCPVMNGHSQSLTAFDSLWAPTVVGPWFEKTCPFFCFFFLKMMVSCHHPEDILRILHFAPRGSSKE